MYIVRQVRSITTESGHRNILTRCPFQEDTQVHTPPKEDEPLQSPDEMSLAIPPPPEFDDEFLLMQSHKTKHWHHPLKLLRMVKDGPSLQTTLCCPDRDLEG